MNQKIYFYLKDKMKLILLFMLVIKLYCVTFPFSNNILLRNSSLIIPLVNDISQKINIFTGNYSEDRKSNNILYYRYFEGNKTYMQTPDDSYEFKQWDIILAGNYSQYYLIAMINNHKDLNLYDFDNSRRVPSYDLNIPLFGTLRKINSDYYYISVKNEIIKMEITCDFLEGKNMFKEQQKKEFYEEGQKLYSVSCDTCKNNECYICSYFINENNYGISSYTNNLKLYYNKKYVSGISNPEGYFNKIIYFKDNIKFIIINAINEDTIRFRYFESDKVSLNNLLKINNTENEYIDIKNTQIYPFNDYSDIAVLDTDKIVKVSCSQTKFFFTIFQFYKEESILTVRTFNDYFSSKKPKLGMWNNKVILGIIFEDNEYGNYNASAFFIFGYPTLKTEDNMINNNFNIYDNNNINISALTTDDFIYENAAVFCKILDIPKDFVFFDAIDKTEITNASYIRTKNNELIFKQYRKNTKAILSFQGIMLGDFKNDTFEIFPSNAEIPKENRTIHEGNKIELNIYINSCNNGFYEVEYEYDICTNTRPEGYYLDVKNNMFKKCNNKCSDCIIGSDDDSNMMCLKCVLGYTYDPITYNCISKKKDVKEVNIKMEPEKNAYLWFFVVIFLLSLIFAIIFIIVIPCKSPKINNEKMDILSESNKDNPILPNSDEMKNIID